MGLDRRAVYCYFHCSPCHYHSVRGGTDAAITLASAIDVARGKIVVRADAAEAALAEMTEKRDELVAERHRTWTKLEAAEEAEAELTKLKSQNKAAENYIQALGEYRDRAIAAENKIKRLLNILDIARAHTLHSNSCILQSNQRGPECTCGAEAAVCLIDATLDREEQESE